MAKKPLRFPRLSRINKTNRAGFTLIELLTAITVGLLLILGLLGVYSVSRTALTRGSELAEIAQNGRIALERISRELRQAEELVTALPEAETPPLPVQIEFQDGHNPSTLTYVRYYLSGNLLRREVSYYTLPSMGAVRVLWRDLDSDGQPAQKTVLEDEIIAEYVTAFTLWGSPLIHVTVNLARNTTSTVFSTTLYGRNLH